MATETKTVVDKLVAAILAGIAKLADSQPTLNFPTDTESESLVRSLFTTGSKPLYSRARKIDRDTGGISFIYFGCMASVAWKFAFDHECAIQSRPRHIRPT